MNEKYENLECDLQTYVNVMMDSSREKQLSDGEKLPGAKQRLEKKTGNFMYNFDENEVVTMLRVFSVRRAQGVKLMTRSAID